MSVKIYNYEDFLENLDVITRPRVARENAENVFESVKLVKSKYPDGFLFFPIRVNNVITKAIYTIQIFGVDVYGNKTKLVVKNAEIFFDIKVPSGIEVAIVKNILLSKLSEHAPVKIGEYESKPIEKYYHNKCTFLRLYMANIFDLMKAVRKVQTELPSLLTYNDDIAINSYDRRTFVLNALQPSAWWVITRPEYPTVGTVSTSITDIVGFWDDPLKYPELAVPRTVTMGWDLETTSTRGMSEVPYPRNPEDNITVGSYAVSHGPSKEAVTYIATYNFRRVNPSVLKKRIEVLLAADGITIPVYLVNCAAPYVRDDPIPMTERMIKGEKRLLKLHSAIFNRVAPDYSTTFNGGVYDEPWVIERADRYGFLLDFVKEMQTETLDLRMDEESVRYQYEHIPGMKISAEEEMYQMKYVPLTSVVQIDMMPIMKRSFKKDEVVKGQAMNFYLKMCGLQPKVDMPHTVMRHLFLQDAGHTPVEDEGDLAALELGLADVLYYAIIDAISPTRLLQARNIIGDSAQVSNLVYLNIIDSIFRADSLKVTNYVYYQALQMGYVMTKRKIYEKTIEGKFKGGQVETPKRGLIKYIPRRGEYHPGDTPGSNEVEVEGNSYVPGHEARPVGALDFSSLYPSIMRELNICPTQYIDNGLMAKAVTEQGVKLHRHFLVEENTVFWTVDHEGDPKKFGILQVILANLIEERKKVKKLLAPITKEIESIKAKYTTPPPPGPERDAYEARLETLEFQYAYLDAKQKAIKVIANTLYGVLGSKKSTFSNVELATIVTQTGRFALTSVIQFHERNGCLVIYGDTDSTYFLFALACYQELYDRRLTMTREEYNRALVELTFVLIKDYAKDVNKFLLTLFPHGYLNMAYEELVFPIQFRDRKKYAGIAHMDEIKFGINKPKDIFSRGYEFTQKGKNMLIANTQYTILKDILDINNNITEMHAVRSHMNYIFKEYVWNYDDVAEFKKYNPDKQNISVKKFYNKMARKDPTNVPLPGEKFKVVVVKHLAYNTRGMTNKATVGECMEFLDRARELNLELDVQYYVDRKLTGIYTGFIFYLPQIDKEHLLQQEGLSEEQMEKNKTFVLREAGKFIRSIIKKEFEPEENYTHNVAKRFYKELAIRYPLLDLLTRDYKFGMMNIETLSAAFNTLDTSEFEEEKSVDAKLNDVKSSDAKSSDAKSSEKKDLSRSEQIALKKTLLEEYKIKLNQIDGILNHARNEFEIIDDFIKDVRVECKSDISNLSHIQIPPELQELATTQITSTIQQKYGNILKFSAALQQLTNMLATIRR